MKKMMMALCLVGAVSISPAFAEDELFEDDNEVEVFDREEEVDLFEGETRAERDLRRTEAGSPFDSRFSAALHGGLINYDAAADDMERKGALGLLLNYNVARRPVTTDTPNNYQFGIQTGVMYSPLGTTGAGVAATDGDLYLVPANVFAGYLFGERLLGAVHGGMNLAYRTAQTAINFGDTGTVSTDSDFSIHPNVGLELGFGLSRRLALMVRSDVMFTDGTDPFVGTVGLGFAL